MEGSGEGGWAIGGLRNGVPHVSHFGFVYYSVARHQVDRSQCVLCCAHRTRRGSPSCLRACRQAIVDLWTPQLPQASAERPKAWRYGLSPTPVSHSFGASMVLRKGRCRPSGSRLVGCIGAQLQ